MVAVGCTRHYERGRGCGTFNESREGAKPGRTRDGDGCGTCGLFSRSACMFLSVSERAIFYFNSNFGIVATLPATVHSEADLRRRDGRPVHARLE